MKKILTLFLVFCTVNVFSQSETVNSSQDIFFETLMDISVQSSSYQVTDEFLNLPSNKNQAILGMKIQQSVILPLGDKWYISTGLGVMGHSYSRKLTNSFQNFSDHLELNYMPDGIDSVILTKVRFEGNYLAIPLNIGCTLKRNSKSFFFVSGGIEQMVLYNSGTSLKVRNRPVNLLDVFNSSFLLREHELKEPIKAYFNKQINSNYLNLNVGIGYEFKIKNNFWLGQTVRYYKNLKSPNKQLSKGGGISLELRLKYALNKKAS